MGLLPSSFGLHVQLMATVLVCHPQSHGAVWPPTVQSAVTVYAEAHAEDAASNDTPSARPERHQDDSTPDRHDSRTSQPSLRIRTSNLNSVEPATTNTANPRAANSNSTPSSRDTGPRARVTAPGICSIRCSRASDKSGCGCRVRTARAVRGRGAPMMRRSCRRCSEMVGAGRSGGDGAAHRRRDVWPGGRDGEVRPTVNGRRGVTRGPCRHDVHSLGGPRRCGRSRRWGEGRRGGCRGGTGRHGCRLGRRVGCSTRGWGRGRRLWGGVGRRCAAGRAGGSRRQQGKGEHGHPDLTQPEDAPAGHAQPRGPETAAA